MAYPTIPYNASTGSDTSPSDKSGSGTNGDISSTTLTLNTTVDFTAGSYPVADDGSDYLHYTGNAGDRHLFQVTAFNPSAAACTSLTLGVAASAARTASNWYVNGTRQTLENDTSRFDTVDMMNAWWFEFDAGTYNLTNTHSIYDLTQHPLNTRPTAWVAKSGAASRPIIMQTTANEAVDCQGNDSCYLFKGLKFTNNFTSYASDMGIETGGWKSLCVIDDCVFDGSTEYSTQAIYTAGQSTSTVVIIRNCYFTGFRDYAINCGSNTATYVSGCTFDGRSQNSFLQGVIYSNNTAAGLHVTHCLFFDGKGIGVRMINTNIGFNAFIMRNTIVGMLGDGIHYAIASASDGHVLHIMNNIITNNGAYGINFTTAGPEDRFKAAELIDFNAFYLNTSGHRNNLTAGANDVALTADPYNNYAGKVFSISDTAGGGAACKGAGFPGVFPDGT
jgi:hypothetical protein